MREYQIEKEKQKKVVFILVILNMLRYNSRRFLRGKSGAHG
jgi:hypothetical protein